MAMFFPAWSDNVTLTEVGSPASASGMPARKMAVAMKKRAWEFIGGPLCWIANMRAAANYIEGWNGWGFFRHRADEQFVMNNV
ncbi:MAG: hypothetical protein KGL11_07045 [Alphaproteobacteria bacterium]|nr:hypothetical protein [Alphaproteobacteria bacterium]